MDLKADDPGCIELDTLARLMLQAAEIDWSLIRRSHPRRERQRRDDDAEAPLTGSGRPAKLLPDPLVLRQPARVAEEAAIDVATASVSRSGAERRLKLSRSQAWATTRPRQARQGAPGGRRALIAGVAVVVLALSATMAKHRGLQSPHTVPVAAKSDAPGLAGKPVRSDEVALAAPHARITSLAAPAVPAAPSPSARIAVPNTTPRIAASQPVATLPERAEPAGPDAQLAHNAPAPVDHRPGQQDIQRQASQPSEQAPEASQHPDKVHEHMAQSESRMAAPVRHTAAAARLPVASSPAREPSSEPAVRSAQELRSVPQRLLLARAALVNRDQRAARGLMEQAQTLIMFQPINGSPRLSTAATSQVTEALIMLSHGDDAGALERLNQLIEALRRTS